MDDLLADDFEEYGSSGKIYSKAEVLDAGNRGATYELADFIVRDLAEGLALVKYRSSCSGQIALRSSIWRQSGGKWQLLHHQATVLPNAT